MLYSIPVHIFLKYRKNLVVLRLHHSLLSPPHDESLSNFFYFHHMSQRTIKIVSTLHVKREQNGNGQKE